MSNLTRFPPKLMCPICQTRLRPATRAEMQHSNATISQAYAHAVQGDLDRKFIVDDKFTKSMEWEVPSGTWVMRCRNCDHVCVHLTEDKIK